MTERTQSGFSRAAVPMLTRAQPVPRARSSEASSLMPPDISTWTPTLRTTSASRSALDPLPGQRGLHRVAVLAAAAGHALDELDRVPVGDVDGGQQGQRGHVRVSSQ